MFTHGEIQESPAAAPVDRGDNIAQAGAALSNPASQNMIKDTMAAAGNTAGNHLPDLAISYPDKTGATASPAAPGGATGGAPNKPADASHDSSKQATAGEHSSPSYHFDQDLDRKLWMERVDEGRFNVRKYNGGNLSDPDFDDSGDGAE